MTNPFNDPVGLLAERDELRAEVEKIERKMKAHRETAVAAIAGTEKLLHAVESERDELRAGFDNERSTLLARIRELRAEVEQLKGERDAEAARYDAVMDTLKAIRQDQDRALTENERLRVVEAAARWIEEDGWTPATREALYAALRQI
jgi:predicted  nucleic acid-binding Zn-ribbon protein